MTELLLANKADINAITQKGATPLALARIKHHASISELLRKRGGTE